jgi:transcription-repair coupling factor (superfamily II helicase)
LNLSDFQYTYHQHPQVKALSDALSADLTTIQLTGLHGSALSVVIAAIFSKGDFQRPVLMVLDDADTAAYAFNDLKHLLSPEQVYYFPSSYKKAIKLSQLDASNEILRTEVLNRIANHSAPLIVISYPEAIMQKVVSAYGLQTRMLKLKTGEQIPIDFLSEMLHEYGFERVDFVYEPGQYSIRGGIVDIFSFAYELPYRFDFFGDEVESIRIFDIESQLSKERVMDVEIIPDLHKEKELPMESLFEFLGKDCLLLFKDIRFVKDKLNQLYDEALVKANSTDKVVADLHSSHVNGDEMLELMSRYSKLEVGEKSFYKPEISISFRTSPQPIFHKNFDLVSENLKKGMLEEYSLFIMSDSVKQTDRIAAIFQDRGDELVFSAVKGTLHEGFIDHDLKTYCYTDHQLFDRFHKFTLRTDKTRLGKVVMTLKELNQFQPGDYMVHVDHGIGTFGGLVKTNVNGTMQEMIKLIYRDDDIIFVSIHSLHRISKYKGKEGEAPKINKLGTGAWERLKERTKSKVKDIARELIKLYAQRKAEQGFQYSPDSYLQQELEASFVYEDTPDQVKSTLDVKKDMESPLPMDRLVCGDVGFGKTEVAVRAAFKAATDSKQVAVLVPTTVLALQHYNTFKSRLADFPVTVEYLSRARSTQQTKDVLLGLENGSVDIIIGTHKLVGKTVKFKDLGLLIIDEEQRFGVTVKEKLKSLKVNVDTLTMTATPIPRTLQFSLMGARDLSIINTPPPNRFPVQTEIHSFDEEVIREAIQLEMNRNGQVFFINNRIQNIYTIEAMLKRLIPGVRVAVGHGQMAPQMLEEIIVDFIEYEYDVLVATTIIESGIDIPNVNTIIINSAHKFGLSDLHQLRGRVGRSNRKAYCYLLAPEMSLLTADARRRLSALETFSELGSGFNIAMQDLDIRGAGNMLGAEQSGFIADLGYETYQKILNEAVHELKEEEFSELYAEEIQRQENSAHYVTDCQIDTDLELMFGADYIENVSERIALYRELDSMDNEAGLEAFQIRLEDRFGKMPDQSLQLLNVVRLRWFAIHYGIEKLVLKNGKMMAFLVSNPMSMYYQSEHFGKVLRYVATHPRQCQLREQNQRRSVVFDGVRTVDEAMGVFSVLVF